MAYTSMRIALLICVSFFCTISVSAQKKFTYEFPDGMPEYVRVDVRKQCEKGAVLYKLNCAQCHNVGKRKKIVPDFEQGFLAKYALRMSNPQHEEQLPETKVTPEELAEICTFLAYKTKSGHNFVPGQPH